MENKNILLIGGAALVGWYLYNKSRQQQTALPGSPGIQAATTPGIPIPIPGTGTTASNVSLPSPGASMSTAHGSNPLATVAQEQTIFNWVNGMNATDQAAFYLHWPEMTSGDIANIMDWLVNLWPSGKSPTQAQTDAWNNWRIKYGIAV